MTPQSAFAQAIALIGTVPGFHDVAVDLRRSRIVFAPSLSDRGQATLNGRIVIGPETLAGEGEEMLVSLAGTLVHEHWHTRQNPFLKTLSFWTGVFTRTHPMCRYEWPAYRQQIAFLKKLAAARPPLAHITLREGKAVAAAFEAEYGPIRD